MNISPHAIAVTGMGVLSAHGLGVTALANALQTGANPFKQCADFPMLSFPLIRAGLDDFHFSTALNYFSRLPAPLIQEARAIARRTPLTIQTSIFAALEAWEQAELAHRPIDHQRIGIVVAGQNTTQAYHYQLQKQYSTELSYLSPAYALHFMDTDQVGTLSELLDIHGEGFTIGGASASGNMGIIQACRLIQLGVLDVCLVVGVLADLSPLEIQAFHNMGALGGKYFQEQPTRACRPFDQAHEGFIWGQASACLVLESMTSAHKASVPIQGIIAGMATHLDGHRHPQPNSVGEATVMQQALAKATLSVHDIQYINTHGSSSPLGDETEIIAIKEMLGSAVHDVWLNSTKSITGHCLWSAGVVEVIATLLQMQKGFLHPNLNLDHPIDQDCRFVSTSSIPYSVHAALSNSFGFGGINTSIAFVKLGHSP